jgi:hypothetical protein
MIVAFKLPMPPGVNNLYPTIRLRDGSLRRVKSKTYAAWLRKVHHLLREQIGEGIGEGYPPETRWELHHFRAVFPKLEVGKNDLDGRFKATVDFLANYFGIEDSHLMRIGDAEKVIEPGCKPYIAGEVRIHVG